MAIPEEKKELGNIGMQTEKAIPFFIISLISLLFWSLVTLNDLYIQKIYPYILVAAILIAVVTMFFLISRKLSQPHWKTYFFVAIATIVVVEHIFLILKESASIIILPAIAIFSIITIIKARENKLMRILAIIIFLVAIILLFFYYGLIYAFFPKTVCMTGVYNIECDKVIATEKGITFQLTNRKGNDIYFEKMILKDISSGEQLNYVMLEVKDLKTSNDINAMNTDTNWANNSTIVVTFIPSNSDVLSRGSKFNVASEITYRSSRQNAISHPANGYIYTRVAKSP